MQKLDQRDYDAFRLHVSNQLLINKSTLFKLSPKDASWPRQDQSNQPADIESVTVHLMNDFPDCEVEAHYDCINMRNRTTDPIVFQKVGEHIQQQLNEEGLVRHYIRVCWKLWLVVLIMYIMFALLISTVKFISPMNILWGCGGITLLIVLVCVLDYHCDYFIFGQRRKH